MTDRLATCRCGQFQVACTGEPVRISVCHCLNCKKRSGSAFAAQARWPEERVTMTDEHREWTATGDSGSSATFLFCPTCGSTVAFRAEGLPGLVAVAIGAFADPAFPQPEYSVYEGRKLAWVEIVGDGIDRYD